MFRSTGIVHPMMPAQESTTVTVDKGPPQYSSAFTVRGRAVPTDVGDGLRLNGRYFISFPGIIKLIEIVVAIVCMSCISPPVTWFARLLTFVVAYSFAVTLLLIFSYSVTLSAVLLPHVHWTFIEMVYTIVTSIAYFIVSVIHLALTNQDSNYPEPFYGGPSPPGGYKFSIQYYGFFGAYIAAGVFGIVNSFVYGGGFYFLFREWKESRSTNPR